MPDLTTHPHAPSWPYAEPADFAVHHDGNRWRLVSAMTTCAAHAVNQRDDDRIAERRTER